MPDALQAGVTFDSFSACGPALSEVFDSWWCAVLLVNADSSVRCANRQARALFEKGLIAVDDFGRLSAREQGETVRIRALVAKVVSPPPTAEGVRWAGVRLPGSSGGDTYMLLTRVSSPEQGVSSQALVVAISPSDLSLPVKLVGELFGLTKAQRHVAALALRGLGPRDVSRALARDYETARTHIRELREKTRTRNRVGLVRTLAAVAAISGEAIPPERMMK